jgi:hypothetical protein
LGGGGQALAGHAPGDAEPDAEGASNLLWSHAIYDGSSDPARRVPLHELGLPVATGLRWQ